MSAISAKTIRSVVPLLDRVLIQRAKAAEKTASGLFLPDSSKEKLSEGTVISVGPGVTTKEGQVIPIALKEGDKVILPSYGGSPIKIKGEDEDQYLLYRSEEILAKIQS